MDVQRGVIGGDEAGLGVLLGLIVEWEARMWRDAGLEVEEEEENVEKGGMEIE